MASEIITSKTLVYKQVPVGAMKPNVDMKLEDREVSLTPPPRGMVVKTYTIGFDPHMRDRMKGPDFQSYVPGYIPDEPMNTFAVARVLKSDHPRFQDGDLVTGVLPLAEYGVVPDWVSTGRMWISYDTSADERHFSLSRPNLWLRT